MWIGPVRPCPDFVPLRPNASDWTLHFDGKVTRRLSRKADLLWAARFFGRTGKAQSAVKTLSKSELLQKLALARDTLRRFRKEASPHATWCVARHPDLQFGPLLLLLSQALVSVGFPTPSIAPTAAWSRHHAEGALGARRWRSHPVLQLASEGIGKALGLCAVSPRPTLDWLVCRAVRL
jgi:hypothetical protein